VNRKGIKLFSTELKKEDDFKLLFGTVCPVEIKLLCHLAFQNSPNSRNILVLLFFNMTPPVLQKIVKIIRFKN
jgi:hypothetical protein